MGILLTIVIFVFVSMVVMWILNMTVLSALIVGAICYFLFHPVTTMIECVERGGSITVEECFQEAKENFYKGAENVRPD